MTGTDNWKDARLDFEENVMPWLSEHGHQVGFHADVGIESAKKIIAWYQMIYKSFDPVSLIKLKEAIEEYKKDE